MRYNEYITPLLLSKRKSAAQPAGCESHDFKLGTNTHELPQTVVGLMLMRHVQIKYISQL